MRRSKIEVEQTQQKILKSAHEIFKEKSYKSATLAVIAKRAGITRGTIYWHFNNKFDILQELLSLLIEQAGEDIKKCESDSIGKIIKLFKNCFKIIVIDEYNLKDKKTIELRKSDEERILIINELINHFNIKIAIKFKQLVELGQKKDEIRNDVDSEFLVSYIISWLSSFINEFFISNRSISLHKKEENIIKNIIKLIKPIYKVENKSA